MSQPCITLPLIVLFLVQHVCGYPSDTVMLLPPFEVRTMDSYPSQPYPSQYQVDRHKPQQLLHTNIAKKPLQAPAAEKQSNQNMTFAEFFEALNEVPHHKGEELHRARTVVPTGRESPAYSPMPRPMGYPRPNYAPSSTYNQTPSVLTPPSEQPKTSLLKPDLSSLFTPIATKASSKMSGLLGLILSLFSGSMSGGLEKSGLKDVLINGIIKPLLVAKGGIKALISKLTIPFIALLLINIEVLITIWWLWEDCPEKPQPTYSYSKPAYNYNNSYR